MRLTGVTIVTGTDTDVGKTIVTATLLKELLNAGQLTALVKPAQTGVGPNDEGDVDVAARLSGLSPSHCVEFVRLPEPLAPTTAARRAGIFLPSVQDIAGRIAHLAHTYDAVVVEGAGGIHVGLDAHRRGLLAVAAELRRLREPVQFVVVARAGLGTLNHSQLTVEAIRNAGFDVAGLAIGSWPENPSVAETCNLEELADICRTPVLAVLPEGLGQASAASIPSMSSLRPKPKLSESTP